METAGKMSKRKNENMWKNRNLKRKEIQELKLEMQLIYNKVILEKKLKKLKEAKWKKFVTKTSMSC